MSHDNEERRPAGNGTALKNRLTTHPDSTPSTPVDEAPRCLACHRPITAAKSIAHGFGPACWTRITTAQRHERAEAIHGRLRALLRRLPDLDVQGLAVLSAALDDAVDALDHMAGGAR